MKACIQGNAMTYELVPPGQHRRNQAERAIQTFKSHFISILTGIHDKFPLSLWCHLLEPNRTHLKPSAPVPSCTTCICICTRPWQPQLHEETIHPDWLRDSNSRQTQRPLVMGHTIGARIQPGHLDGTPLLLPSLCHQDKSNENKRHCFFQAPVHHQPSKFHLNPTWLQQPNNLQRPSRATYRQAMRRRRH
jgi:hypothetical protein